jgi:RNA 2',3'-cyclic 3'-phosphodiesterase
MPVGAGADTNDQQRLFIAVPVPDDVTAAIAEVVERVRAEAAPSDGRDVRWVRLDDLHITLRFLGPTPPDRVNGVAEATRIAAANTPGFEVVLGRAGTFPEARRPRALWIDILDGAADLAAAARHVDDELRRRGWALDDRPFRGHLTLARADGVRAGSTVAARLKAAAETLELHFRAERIVLFESITGHGPARYEPLDVAALAVGHPGGKSELTEMDGTIA